ncbi:DUF4233 domain-containing protein [Ornithinimicrobium cavernae]|uniref:DUF4233 domain-containing protein n=1 Tax=Ornithinimicrobium cavernae TaxID=2666047 RepID=UPI000D692C7D|nr:DUF4233 domain-containing protein [Ornithinimicrobium cavernae]
MSWLRHLRFSGVPGKITRRLTSIVLIGLALTLFFGGLAARQLELAVDGDSGRADLLLVGGIVLAVLALVAAGALRRPWGLTLGWVLLGLTAVSTFLLTAMGIVTLIFGALWVLALVQGASMEEMTRDWIAEHGDVHPDEQPHPAPQPDRAHGDPENKPTERTESRGPDPTERTEREGDT